MSDKTLVFGLFCVAAYILIKRDENKKEMALYRASIMNNGRDNYE